MNGLCPSKIKLWSKLLFIAQIHPLYLWIRQGQNGVCDSTRSCSTSLEPGRRTQGVLIKEAIQLSVIKAQVLLPFQGHLESPCCKCPKFPLSLWGGKAHPTKWRKSWEEMAQTPSIHLLPRKNMSMRHEVTFQALSNDLDHPTKQMKAAGSVLQSDTAEKYLPMQQLCKCVRLLSS